MDFYQYINSPDIRDFLREKAYEFSPLECAYLVYQSMNHTLEEKFKAWEWLIANTEDCSVPERVNLAPQASLHDALKRYIEFTKKYLGLFEREGDAAVYLLGYPEHNSSADFDLHIAYSNLERCKQTAAKELEDFAEADKHINTDSVIHWDTFLVRKLFINGVGSYGSGVYIDVLFDRAMNPREIQLTGFYESSASVYPLDEKWQFTKDEDELYTGFFHGMWFDIPTPFCVGDVVCDCNTGEPFVLLGMNAWNIRERRSYKTYVNGSNGDASDMYAYGYSMCDKYSGEQKEFLYDDHMIDYLDCTYYRKPLIGSERLIGAYALYVKGEIDAWELLHLDRLFKAEKEVENNLPDKIPLWLLTEDKQEALNIANKSGVKDESDLFTYLKNLAPKKRGPRCGLADNPDIE